MERLLTHVDESVTSKDLFLSCSGLASLNFEPGEPDFEIVFGESNVTRVHAAIAEFLSPRISRLRKIDRSTSRYVVNRKEAASVKCQKAFEALLETVLTAQAIHVDSDNFESLFWLALEFENTELSSLLLNMYDMSSITIEDVVHLLRFGDGLPSHLKPRFDDMVQLAASHFYEISPALFESLDIDTATLLLSHPSLKVDDEDSVYDFIASKIQHDPSFSSLFEFVYFEYLSASRIEAFADLLTGGLLPSINASIWSRVRRRLVLTPSTGSSKRCASGQMFRYDESSPLTGILAYLTNKYNGNVHDMGVVNITSSSIFDGDWMYHPKNAADFESDSCFFSRDEPNTWICYDFGDNQVIPTSYTLKSSSTVESGDHNLKSWVIEVSNDGEEWTIIDSREDNDDLDGTGATHNFSITPGRVEQASRFIRLRETGPNHCADGEQWYFVLIEGFEIFGRFL